MDKIISMRITFLWINIMKIRNTHRWSIRI